MMDAFDTEFVNSLTSRATDLEINFYRFHGKCTIWSAHHATLSVSRTNESLRGTTKGASTLANDLSSFIEEHFIALSISKTLRCR